MTEQITIRNARLHNLKNISLAIPKNKLVVLTGLSGSGKSTLGFDILHKEGQRQYLESLGLVGLEMSKPLVDSISGLSPSISVDQHLTNKSPRSTVGTSTDVYTYLRVLFARLGHRPCPNCGWDIPPSFDISQVLEMTVEEALNLFQEVPGAVSRLQVLSDVGLGYLQLGQPATTLSGGEAQRVKLAKELGRRTKGMTLYLLDEPTTGLHLADTARLLAVLQRLVDAGNSVILVEHNLDLVKAADWVIDLGPEGGKAGGRLVAEGPPEQLTQIQESITGQFLNQIISETGRS